METIRNEKLERLLRYINREVNRFAEEQVQHIDRLTGIGIALSAESDINKVFDLILDEAIAYTNADGATIYQISADRRALDFKVVYNRTMHQRQGGSGDPVTWPSVPLFLENGEPQLRNMSAYVTHHGQAMRLDDVYEQDLFDNSGTKKFDALHQYRSKSMIAVPLKDHENEVQGVIQLINAETDDGEVITFTDEHMAMVSSLASLTAIILTNKRLVGDLEKLVHQFVRSIAGAIDRKSKYTGGHISRVAELVERIAAKVQDDHCGHFTDYRFTPDELQELSLAGWMHDLGKIITPTHVMDKATKLEAIVDRFELVKTRFELVKAIIRTDIVRMEYEGKTATDLKIMITRIDDDLEFIRRSNLGGEFMSDADVARIEEIAAFRYPGTPNGQVLITENEARNLVIRKGTLSNEELSIMRDHAQITREMLSQLTFPRKYRNVPFYAGAHHEKLNGKGYPLNLTADQLPLQARIIAVADLFEALTACDRPYRQDLEKKQRGKPLSEALKLMGMMVQWGEIDPDLLDLFLDSGLWNEYAERYLLAEQRDEVNISAIKALYRKNDDTPKNSA
jgi:HD-GYP domain-containing protein (c-di-GMP phosphodiesterase class II)